MHDGESGRLLIKFQRTTLETFLNSEAAGGIILMLTAALAIFAANSAVSPAYFGLLKISIAGLSIHHWINDGLMTVFFLLVGLEIKRELLEGELSTWPQRILPGIAAAGGMVFPALVFIAINSNNAETIRGWAIPSATDIAFALGVLALLGKRIPLSLKIFLTAVAIIDDLGAIAIIALFYTDELSVSYILGAAFVVSVLRAFNAIGFERLTPYVLLGALLWFLMLKSGIHATLAGVAIAFTIPLKSSPGDKSAPSALHRLEQVLAPWVAFLVVPTFGFANAGVSFEAVTFSHMLHPVTLGIAAGLFLGKQFGVFLSVWLSVRLGFAERPSFASWTQVYGVSVLCGIGFTMSLFIGLLAFPASTEYENAVKFGVLAGSFMSALLGAAVLLLARNRARLSE